LKRSLKKQIKQDELVTWYDGVQQWAQGRTDQLKIGAIGLVVLLVGASALFSFRSHREREAERAFAEALDVFHTPLAQEQRPGTQAPPVPGAFSSQEEKYRKALAAFEGIEQRYGSQLAGRRAEFYAALCRVQLGQAGAAEKTLKEIAVTEKLAQSTMCGICRGMIKPGTKYLQCTCRKYYHNLCADRTGECPSCGKKL
jgi:hypothetical protein